MRAGFAAWWLTKEWWIQALLWTVVINGSVSVAVWGEAPDDIGVFALYGVMSMFAAIAIAIIMQEAIVGEKRSGTAAWVMSKPASRPAFMLSKLIPNAVGVVATMAVIPSAFLAIQLWVADVSFSPVRFALGVLVVSLNLMFYLTLTLMLGTVFDSAAPVIAIPLAIAFGQQLIASIPGLGEILPWGLVVPVNGADDSVTSAVILGQPIPTPGAAAFTLTACVVFVVLSFWRWSRTEL